MLPGIVVLQAGPTGRKVLLVTLRWKVLGGGAGLRRTDGARRLPGSGARAGWAGCRWALAAW